MQWSILLLVLLFFHAAIHPRGSRCGPGRLLSDWELQVSGWQPAAQLNHQQWSRASLQHLKSAANQSAIFLLPPVPFPRATREVPVGMLRSTCLKANCWRPISASVFDAAVMERSPCRVSAHLPLASSKAFSNLSRLCWPRSALHY